MNILLKNKPMAFLIAPAVSALSFYLLALLSLEKGEYLPGMQNLFLYLAIPLSYLGVLLFGLPGLWLLRKYGMLNLGSFLTMSFFSGVLTLLGFITGIALLQQVDDFKEVYESGLEPTLIAGISAVLGAFIFTKLSGILEK